jgi:hypothetical protein
VPFIARYRKEITGGLDDAQLRTLEERLRYLRELEERRAAILESIANRASSTPRWKPQILAADSKGRLEDIYLPFKPKRRTKAQIAKEAGLEPLADLLLTRAAERSAAWPPRSSMRDKQVADVAAALDGARAILVERFAEDADLIGELREQMWSNGRDGVHGARGQEGTEGEKFKDYFDFSEPLHKLPSHRILALFRGEKEEILDLQCSPRQQPRSRRAEPRPPTSCASCSASASPIRAARRPLAGGHRALGLAHQDPDASRHRPADAAVDRRPRTRRARVRRQPARPAAGRAGRRARHHGPRSRASAPASRSRWSTPPARCWRPRRSIRTNRSALGRGAGDPGQARAQHRSI